MDDFKNTDYYSRRTTGVRCMADYYENDNQIRMDANEIPNKQ